MSAEHRASINRRDRSRRFGSSTVSLSFRTRVVLSTPVVLVAAFLAASMVTWAISSDPRFAALPMMFLGIVLLYGVPFLREVWRPNPGWQADRSDAARLERKLTSALGDTGEAKSVVVGADVLRHL